MKKIYFLMGMMILASCVQAQSPSNGGFEDGTNFWTTTGTAGATNARTGINALSHTTSSSSNVAHTNSTIISIPNLQYGIVIGWCVGSNGATTASVGGTLNATTSSTSTNNIGTTLTRLVYSSAQNTSGSAQNFTCRVNTRSTGGATTVYWDDVIMYASTTATPDLTKPTSATTFTNGSINSNSVNFTWTNGSDAGTGLQATIILRTTNTSALTPTMNDQGVYSVTGGTSGPNIVSTDWTVISTTVGSGTNSYSDNTVAASTSYKYAVIHRDLAYNYSIALVSGTITTPSAGTPDISLSSPNPAITAGNIIQGTTNNPIYRFDLAVTTASATLSGVTVTTAGTYSASDLTNLKCWYSSDATFNAGSDVPLSTKTISLSAGPQVFPTFTNQAITSGTTGYFFITADVPCGATTSNTISVNAITTADITFLSGNKSGTAFAGDAQTFVAPTLNNVTGLAATNGNTVSSVSWTNPTGCFDEIMIVASASLANTGGTPTGDGTAYTANLAYGSGTAFGNGFVVYKGNTSPQVVTSLTNGTTYYFKVFTRFGTTWSSGVEVNATPAAASSATDYFRSKSPGGNWNSTASWQTSADGSTNWIDATLTPTSSANTISILNEHTITVSAGVTADQIVIQSGGELIVSSGITFTLANGTGIDLDVFGTFTNSGTVTWTGTMTIETGGTYVHNTTSASTNAYSAATISSNSTWIYRGSSSLIPSATFSNRIYENLRLESTSGNLTITPSIGAGNSCTANDFFIGANVIFNCTSLNLTSAFNIAGNFTNNGTIDNTSGYFNPTFSGNSKTISGSTVPNMDAAIISSTASIALSTNIALPFSTGNVTVQTGGVLVAATSQITGLGSITINGTLRTSNTNGLSSTGTFATTGTKTLGSSSIIEYNAAGAQSFTARSDYANVIINGGGDKTISGNTTIGQNLTLTNGKVVLGTNNLIVVGTVSGGSSSNYVQTNGTGTLTVNNITSAKTFPIGNARYNPLIIENGSGHNWSARVADGVTADIGYNTNKAVLLTWNITPSVNPPSGGADITFQFDEAATPTGQTGASFTTAENVQAWHRVNGLWIASGTPAPVLGSAGARTVKATGLTKFSDYALANVSGPLPVSFLSFAGQKQGSVNKLVWSTASESNNRGFEVQRSVDGINYSTIGFVNSLAVNGNSSDVLNYSFIDNAVTGTKQYYRLRQVDNDNRSRFSTIVLIKGETPLITSIDGLFPNPANTMINVLVAAPAKEKVTLVISDLSGKVVSQKVITAEAGSNTIPVDISLLNKGSYFVRLVCENGCESASKFLKL